MAIAKSFNTCEACAYVSPVQSRAGGPDSKHATTDKSPESAMIGLSLSNKN